MVKEQKKKWKQRVRLLSVMLLSLILIGNTMDLSVLSVRADDDTIVTVTIGEEVTSYTDFDEAWKYAQENSSDDNPATVTLKQSVTPAGGAARVEKGNIVLTANSGCVLDDSKAQFYIYSGTLTLKNININSTTTSISIMVTAGCLTFGEGVEMTSSGKLLSMSGGTVTVEKGAYLKSTGGDVIYQSGGSLYISGGTLEAPSQGYYALYVKNASAVTELTGGTFVNNSGYQFLINVSSSKLSGLLKEGYAYKNGENFIDYPSVTVFSSTSGVGSSIEVAKCTHSYSDWKSDGRNHTKTCKFCNDTQTEEHSFYADGSAITDETCSVCGTSRTYGSLTDGMYSISGTSNNDWYSGTVEISALTGYDLYEVSSNEKGVSVANKKDKIVLTDETSGQEVSFYLVGKEDGVFYEVQGGASYTPKTIEFKIDNNAPTGKITLGCKEWSSFTESSGGFTRYKGVLQLGIETTGTPVSSESICYYLTDKEMTEEDLENYNGWTVSGDDSTVRLSSGSYYIYAKLTDDAGHITYISSEGITVDNMAPSITKLTFNTDTLEDTQAEFTFTVDEDCTYYYEVLPAYQSTPTADQIKESVSTGANNDKIGTGSVKTEEGSTVTIKVAGLNPNTTYNVYVVAQDADLYDISGDKEVISNNISSVVSASATTKAAKPQITTQPIIKGTYGQTLKDMTLTDGVVEADSRTIAGTWTLTDDDAEDYPTVGTTKEYKVTFTPDDIELYDSMTTSVVPEVSYLSAEVEAVLSGDKKDDWYIGDVKVTAPSGYTIAATPEALLNSDGASQIDVTADGETEVTYALKDSSGMITAAKTITVKRDTTAPTGEIAVATNKWTQFLNTITFGVFFKETTHVTITGEDLTSGVKNIQYYLADGQQTKDQLEALEDTEWTAGSSFDMEPDNKYVIYAKITDKAGNVAYISSDGIVLDAGAPTVGFTPDKTVYKDMENAYDGSVSVTVSVSDDGSDIDSVVYTLDNGEQTDIKNGDSVQISTAGKHTLSVTAKDKAGNETTKDLTVCVYTTAPTATLEQKDTVVYDGKAIEAGVDFTLTAGDNTATVTYSYKADGGDTYTSGLPVNAGTYTIKAELADDTLHGYKASEAVGTVTIQEAVDNTEEETTTAEPTSGTATETTTAEPTSTATEPTTTEPTSTAMETTTTEPTSSATTEPTTTEPAGSTTTETTTTEPASSTTTEPTTTEPTGSTATETTTTEPASSTTTEPTTTVPISSTTTEPTTTEPTSSETTEPTTTAPASSTATEPTTTAPAGSATTEPTTTAPISGTATESTTAPASNTTTEPATTTPTSSTATEITTPTSSTGVVWSTVRNRVTNTAAGGTISVDMNGDSVVPGDVLDSIKDKDITIAFEVNNRIKWNVNGTTITAASVSDIDFGVSYDTNNIPSDVASGMADGRENTQISLAYDGNFGFEAVLTIDVGTSHTGLYANLFYYNPNTRALEYIDANQVAADGTTSLRFSHASDYIIVYASEVMNSGTVSNDTDITDDDTAKDDSTESPKMGDAMQEAYDWFRLGIIGSIVLIFGICVSEAMKKKADTKK
jgi:hypothetical protein